MCVTNVVNYFFMKHIETHKTHTHTKSIDDKTSGNDAVTKTSGVTEDNRKDHDEEILEKGRNILNRMIRKPGSKKKPRMTARKQTSPCKTSKEMKNTTLRCSARIANSSLEKIDNEGRVISDEKKSVSEMEKDFTRH